MSELATLVYINTRTIYEGRVKMNNQPMNVIPMVIESGARGERAFDIYSLLLRERIVMLGMPINDQ
ncbi:unnamed protein product, partial [marine sediment metagenome]